MASCWFRVVDLAKLGMPFCQFTLFGGGQLCLFGVVANLVVYCSGGGAAAAVMLVLYNKCVWWSQNN